MKKIICIIGFCAAALCVWAIPARRGAFLRTGTDGTQREVFLHGDAWFHYITDAEGNWLDEKSLLPLSAEEKEARIKAGKARQAQRAPKVKETIGVLNLAPRGLMILVNFSDKKFTTPVDTIKNMINGEHFERHYDYDYSIYDGRHYQGHVDAYGSARQYFMDQSWKQYTPYFDVVGPVEASKASTYYGRGSDYNIDELIIEACQLANPQVDFTQYDNDHDGQVDIVYVLYAGYGAADSGEDDYIWPHNSSVYSESKFDGKKISNYACSNEIQYGSDLYNGIGTFVHEFGHALGLPDLYPTISLPWGGTPHTLNDWDIMDYGPYNNEGNTPPAYSAYERFFMGWLTPRVLTAPEKVTLGKLNTDTTALLLCEGNSHNLNGLNPSPATFYLLENRDQTGWDASLPGAGLLITKIQYSSGSWASNSVNINASSMGVDIIEAKANDTDWGAATDAFPAGATSWTDFTGHEVTNIQLDNGIITFDYRGAQGIEDVVDGNITVKRLWDGNVIIIRNGVTYDLNGRKISMPKE